MLFAMYIQAKGKGALVLAVGIVPLIALFIIAHLIIDNFRINAPNEAYQFLGGVSLLFSAAINKFVTGEEDDDVEKSSSFMYIPIEYWSKIYFFLGLVVIADGIAKYYHL
jgi:hypothetical protein